MLVCIPFMRTLVFSNNIQTASFVFLVYMYMYLYMYKNPIPKQLGLSSFFNDMCIFCSGDIMH